ncbi:MAG: TetR family transcriptional regulator, partial [Lachnospiraceae bacterium]|nr:TetR family transcriptional regulator [Lachnospiraceae bacterium]
MARKESITKEILLQAACELLKEEGEENMTVRKIAAKANCSTQPIFRVFKGMDDLNETVFMIMAEEFQESAQ